MSRWVRGDRCPCWQYRASAEDDWRCECTHRLDDHNVSGDCMMVREGAA